MHLHSLVKKGSSFALALATITSPLVTTQAFASSLTPVEGVELAQASPTPAPAPAPAPTPAPAPAPAPTPAPTSEGGFTPAPAATPPAAGSRDVAPAATTTSLTERTDLIGACRRTNRALEVFRDTALSPVNRVGTFDANTQVRLTGVVGAGRAQVYWPTTWPPTGTISVVGWVNAANLTDCGLPISREACYRVVASGLSVRSGPSASSAYRGSLAAGAIALATSNPPRESTSSDGRIWAEIDYQASAGWISRTGTGGVGTNATRLPDEQCP